MDYSVFFSWQSDLPNRINRTPIKEAINKAIKTLNADNNGMHFTYEESTSGEVGAPNIAQTIIEKISKSDIFICDISIVNKHSKFRKTPNPNVMFELGFAFNLLGWDKIICIFNTESGNVGQLPFDINHNRLLCYSSEKSDYKTTLVTNIKHAVEAMIQKGIIYNPLKEHIKGKIDYCLLQALKQQCCLVYGTITMSEALTKVNELISLSETDINDKLLDGHTVLGYFTENTLQDIRPKLDNIFTTITTSNLYPTAWALTILKLVDWLRSYQWYISSRSGLPFSTKSLQSVSSFNIIRGKELNPDNTSNSCILVRKVGGGKGQVLYSANIPLINKHILLTPQHIIEENAKKYGACIYRLNKIAIDWLSLTGGEFILDPDFYGIT